MFEVKKNYCKMLKQSLIIQNVITIGACTASEMEVIKLNELLYYLNNYTMKRRNRQRFSALILCLAVIVSFAVSVGLIEPAESASGELICGMEEHEHTQDCFELICGFDEETEEEISVDAADSDSEETAETTVSTEGITTSTENAETVPVHMHSDECYRLICLTEAHLHKQDCYNQPVETAPVTTEISTSASTSTGTDTTATTEQTAETSTTTTELSEEIYELNAALFGELYKDRVDILADAKTITKGGETYTYYEIEDFKFYYENGELYVNEYFGYRIDGGTAGDNAHHPASNPTSLNEGVNYNGTTYNTFYNLNNAGRFISFTAPENGKLIFVLNSDAYTINLSVNGNEGENFVFTNTGEPNIIEISVAKGNEYKIARVGDGKPRLAYAEFVPAVKTEEYKFYYDDEKILHYNECFSYPDGTDGPNANTVTPNLEVVYNGNTYTNTYNFNKTDARYITLKAPKDGTLFMAFDGGTYNINVKNTSTNEVKKYSCNNSDQNVIAVPVAAGGEYKIYQNANDDNNARLAYAEFVPTFTKEEIAANLDKTYRIRNVKTGLYLEVEKANPDNNTKIKIGQYSYNDNRNDFKFVDAGNGNFNIKTLLNDSYMLDYDDTNIKTYSTNNGAQNNRLFKFNINDDGTYKINTYKRNGGDVSNLYIDQTDNNYVKASNAAIGDDFIIVEATEIVYPKADIDTTKTYLIKNVRSRLYMHRNVYKKDKDGKIAKDADGNPIVESPNSTDLVQWKDTSIYSQFKFEKTGDGKYKIKNGNDYISVESVGLGAYADLKSGYDEFYAEQMPNGSIRFYQIDNNGEKFYLEIVGEAINDGAEVDLWEADRVKDHQCFFLVPVIEPETVVDGKTRIEARVIFGDYNDGKITINNDGTVTDTRKRYDEPAYIPTFNLYGASKIDEQKGNLVVDISIARKDWCYQYNYVWYQEAGSNYYVGLDGVENNYITYNGKTFKVYYLRDDELGHPGNAPSKAYRTDPSALKVDGDQVVYIFLDPTDDRPNAEKFNLTMKKRWDGYNQEGYKNRPKEKIIVQLQKFNGSSWEKFEQDGYMNWYYYETTDSNGEKYFVNKTVSKLGDLYYKKVDGVEKFYTDKACTTPWNENNYSYNTLKGTTDVFKTDATNRLKVYVVDVDSWNNVLLTADGENNPQHFKDGYYYIWNDLPVGDYRVVETQSFYDANDNNVLDEGDRDTSHDYYYMSFPPSRDSSGVLHIQNFTKDMVIEVQKKWQDDEGGDMTLNKPIEFEVYRCLGDPRNSVPENPDPVGKFTTNENGYAFITSRAYDSNFDENSQGNGYYYGVHDMETKNGDTKYHYFIKEIVPDGYKLINGNEDGYVWRAGIDAESETKDYSVDYEDGDSRKFIITNKAKIGLRVEKEWYNTSVSDENKIDYYNNNTDNPIYPKFKIYKGDRPGTPVVNDNICSVNGVALEKIADVTIGKDGYFELVSDENDKHGDSSYVNDELNMLSDTKYELVSTGFDGNIFRNASDHPANIQGDYIVVDNTNRFWVGSNKTKNNQVKAPYITGTLTLEFENYDENSILSVGNRCTINGNESNETKYYNIKDANGVVSIPGLYVDGNYRIMGNNCTLNIKKVTFTHDAYYYIQEITNDNSNYTLSNGDSNGFVKIGDNFYTTITANNRYPVVTAQNIPKVNLDITKEWYADADMEKQLENISDKSMKFKIYKAFAQGTPKETTVDNTASCYLESGNTTCSLSEYTDDIKVKNNSTTTATVSCSNGYYTTPADGKLSIIELPAYDPVTENDKTIYKKVCYYIREADGNYKLLNGNDCGFVQNGGNTYGTSFEDNGNYIFQNQPTIDLTVNKIWKDANGKVIDNKVDGQIKFELYQTTNETPDPSKDTKIVKVGDKTATNGLFETKNYTITFENLPAYDLNGNLYRYYIKEETSTISATHETTYNGKAYFTEVVIVWNKYGAAPKIEIVNKEIPISYELPETGGSGTHGCTAAGGAIVLLSAAVLLLKRRKKMV